MNASLTFNPPEVLDIAALLATLNVPVPRLTSDSRRVQTGDGFAAYPGAVADGRNFIGDAIANGAGSVLWEAHGFSWKPEWKVPNASVSDLKQRLGMISDVVYGHPSRELWMIGITGTNGKTTCAHWIAGGLESNGQRTGVMGTLGNGLYGALERATNTTEEAALLQQTLRLFKQAGASAVAMEVSSHGIDQGRINGVEFDVALFTNLSRDHLDYHRNMAEYGAVKARLFDNAGLSAVVINSDDTFGQSLIAQCKARGLLTFSYGERDADITVSNVQMSASKSSFDVATPWGSGKVSSQLIGQFNISNMLGVLGVLLVSDVPLRAALEYLETVRPPAGRMERLGGDGLPLVIVDYAHSPDALAKVLQALRPVATGGQVICVFGCGGDRDRGKRPEMGRVASELADRIVITTDNSRSEDPASIANEILTGIDSHQSVSPVIELDRAKAIADAIAAASPQDIVLIAGKGHEPYQEIHGVRYPFSDTAEAARALTKRNSE